MSNSVFILGAGASKMAGAPLMNDFLDTARGLLRSKRVGTAEKDFQLAFDAISELQAVHSKSELDLQNIESIFTTFDIAKTLGRFPGREANDIDNLLHALKTLIVKTLELTITFPVSNGRVQSPPPPYGEFVQLLLKLKQSATPLHKVSVITFNYDIALDTALCLEGVFADYGLPGNEVPGNDSIPLLKLHGSLNWTETLPTVSTKAVVPWHIGKYLQGREVRPPTTTCCIPIGSQLIELSTKHGKFVTGEVVLVPPTSNKGDTHRTLTDVWKRAARELSEAENIFVIGYSMPETDTFFRYLFALGTVGPVMLERFWVFNPNRTGIVKSRFEGLLGPGAKARFKYIEEEFNKAIVTISDTFSLK